MAEVASGVSPGGRGICVEKALEPVFSGTGRWLDARPAPNEFMPAG
jgi:hypothetical protein